MKILSMPRKRSCKLNSGRFDENTGFTLCWITEHILINGMLPKRVATPRSSRSKSKFVIAPCCRPLPFSLNKDVCRRHGNLHYCHHWASCLPPLLCRTASRHLTTTCDVGNNTYAPTQHCVVSERTIQCSMSARTHHEYSYIFFGTAGFCAWSCLFLRNLTN